MAGGGTGGHVIPGAGGGARAARARPRGALHRNAARHGSEAGPAGELSHRVDRDRRIEARRFAEDACRRWRNCRERVAGVAHAGSRRRRPRCSPLGGYVAGPVLLAALWKRVPVVVMEPNAVPGFHASASGALCRARAGEFPGNRALVSRGPRRSHRAARARGIFRGASAGRRGSALTVLITGGSQGSRTLNRAAEESWPLWKKGRRPADPSDRRAALRRTGSALSRLRRARRDSRVSGRYAGGVRRRPIWS